MPCATAPALHAWQPLAMRLVPGSTLTPHHPHCCCSCCMATPQSPSKRKHRAVMCMQCALGAVTAAPCVNTKHWNKASCKMYVLLYNCGREGQLPESAGRDGSKWLNELEHECAGEELSNSLPQLTARWLCSNMH